ncbi:hypothetical protein CHUAL_003398 [Chamberlinius hualienensis]
MKILTSILTIFLCVAVVSCNRVNAAKRRLSARNKLATSTSPATKTNSDTGYKVVCYYTNWAQYRTKTGRFLPEDIDPNLCTHVIFAFVWLKKGRLSPFEANDQSKDGKKGLYERVNELKLKNPKLKTLLAIGGWSFGTEKFKEMSGSRYARQTFVLDAIPYLRNRNFDGLDLDWEYPKGADDKKNFVLLIKELYQAFEAEADETKKQRLLLTAAVPASSESVNAGYDVPEISKYLDFINLMSYDFHGKWESMTGHNSPLYAPSNDTNWRKQLCMDHAANMWVRLGAPKEKMIIGMGTYGRSFTLANPEENGVNVPTTGGGTEGVYTKESGFLAYYEICELLKEGASYVWDDEMKAPYAFYDDQWVGFDDEKSIKTKLKWLKENGYGGSMVWTLDMDDFNGICGNGPYPLIGLMKQELLGIPRPQGSEITDWSKGKIGGKYSTPKRKSTKQSKDDEKSGKDEKPDKPEFAPPKIVCYFTTWAVKRHGLGNFRPDNVNGSLCTHLVIAFAGIKEGKLTAPSDTEEELYKKIVEVKKLTPSLKIMLAVGGWNFGSKPFREMTETVFKMTTFVYDAVEYLRKLQLDGLEINWEYPRGEDEKNKYTELLKELKDAFEGEAKVHKVPRLLLSAAVPANSDVVEAGYDVPEISKLLDIINVMTYDFHGLWENQVGHNSPLKPLESAGAYDYKLTVEYGASIWVKLGAPKHKLMIGTPTYGRTFTLGNPSSFDIGSPAEGGGLPGKYTKETGILAFYEICDFLRDNATLVWDTEQLIPFAYKGNQWVGFDDERSIKGKMDWLKTEGYGGAMVWSLDLDDFRGHCGGPGYPLLDMINKELKDYGVPGTVYGQDAESTINSPIKVDANELVCKEAEGFISYHKDLKDCKMYYMCEGERRHHMACPSNLVFNLNESVCDWPENVEGCQPGAKKEKEQ